MSASLATTIFDRIVTGGDVERWLLQHLRTWSGTYLSEVERQHGVEAGTYQRVRQWTVAGAFEKWPEDQLPAIVLVSPGLAERPLKNGEGVYRARWSIGVSCICSAATMAAAHDMAMIFTAAHRTLLEQKPRLAEGVRAIDWLDERYDDLAFDDTRALYAGQVTTTIEVDSVLNASAGPLTPSEPIQPTTDPYPLWPQVQLVDVDVEPQAITTKGEE